ncbi:hypothetical protein CYMTET_37417 [Cymbomonas tetramitiformis]|uniref:Uncharacterized protein n=1 Tax=Cymbomonas tetramitiformis TaxID=36881 RepID=A0AAE0F6C2_9CHLO|nr:hypothetical protein CYMTET_37417 [Cymbomonas tetramitiformis]
MCFKCIGRVITEQRLARSKCAECGSYLELDVAGTQCSGEEAHPICWACLRARAIDFAQSAESRGEPFEVRCIHCDPPAAQPPQPPPPRPRPQPAGVVDGDRDDDDEVVEIDIAELAGAPDVVSERPRYTRESVKRAFSDSDKTSAHAQRAEYLEAVIAAKLKERTRINDAENLAAARNHQRDSRLQRLIREAEELCSLRCPGRKEGGGRCEYVMEGFDGCMAVHCNTATGCGTHFCAYCFATFNSSQACHNHVYRCPESIVPRQHFCDDAAALEEFYAEKKRRRVEAMLVGKNASDDDRTRVMERVNTILQ